MSAERLCCCGHGWHLHDPATCTGKGCDCRGFHPSDCAPALHRAMHRRLTSLFLLLLMVAGCATPQRVTVEGLARRVENGRCLPGLVAYDPVLGLVEVHCRGERYVCEALPGGGCLRP